MTGNAKSDRKNNSSKGHEDIVHLGRGRRAYRVERGEHGEFKSIKGPVDEHKEELEV